MTQFQYKVVPAPAKGEKIRGVKAAEDRFALAIERLMNEMAAEGWEFQRAELLPSEERSGLTSSQTIWRNLLVFRRPADSTTIEAPAPVAPPATADASPESDPELEGRKLASAAELASPGAEQTAQDDTLDEATTTEPPAPEDEDDETSLDGPNSALADRAARMRQD